MNNKFHHLTRVLYYALRQHAASSTSKLLTTLALTHGDGALMPEVVH